MLNRLLTRRVSVFVLLVLVLAQFMGRVPVAMAALEAEPVLADDNSEFVQGSFGLTSLVQAGGVQLLPLGSLQTIRSGQPALCQRLAYTGTASYRASRVINGQSVQTTYFYVVGGRTSGGNHTKTVCHTYIAGSNGITAAWSQSQNQQLPVEISQNQAVAVRTSSGSFVYSFGGVSGLGDLSVADIYRATINASNGAVGAWTKVASMPDDEGRHAFALTLYETEDGKNFVYIFGGMTRFQFSGVRVLFHRDAWRAEILANGSLSAWTDLADIPLPTAILSCAGLREAKATNFPVVTNSSGSSSGTPTLYLMGGIYEGSPNQSCTQATKPSADVFRATLGSDGALTWNSTSAGANRYTLTTSLYGHQGVGFNQKIYVLGGFAGDVSAPTRRVFSTYAKSDQSLHTYTGGANFTASGNIIPQPLYAHGAEVGYYNNLPIMYIFGGRNSAAASNDDYQNTVYFAIPSVDEQGNGGFPTQPDFGSYVSPVIDLRGTATLLNVKWEAVADAATDIEMAYRMGSSSSDIRTKPWTVVDGDPSPVRGSVIGNPGANNAGVAGGPTQRYIQYRAILKTTLGTKTPILKKVTARVRYTTFPNLQPEFFNMSNASIGPSISIMNKPSPNGSTTPVLDADVTGSGTFYVDLHLFAPGEQVVMPTVGGNNWNPQGEIFAEINKANLRANQSYTIPNNQWKDNRTCINQNQCPVVSNWRSFFNEDGTWNVVVVVDSWNNLVQEADLMSQPWEQDNVRVFQVLVTNSSAAEGIFLPIIRR